MPPLYSEWPMPFWANRSADSPIVHDNKGSTWADCIFWTLPDLSVDPSPRLNCSRGERIDKCGIEAALTPIRSPTEARPRLRE